MANEALGIASGIARGVNQASANILNLTAAKNKLDRENEKYKNEKKLKDAQIKKIDYEIEEAKTANQLKKAQLEQGAQFMQMFGVGGQGPTGAPGQPGGGQAPTGNGFIWERPGYEPEISYSQKGGFGVKVKPIAKKELRAEQNLKQNSIAYVDSIVDLALRNNGVIPQKGDKPGLPYSKAMILRAVSKEFPEMDISDADLQAAIPTAIDKAGRMEKATAFLTGGKFGQRKAETVK